MKVIPSYHAIIHRLSIWTWILLLLLVPGGSVPLVLKGETATSLSLSGPPQYLDGEGWLLQWNSTTNRVYQIQRSLNLVEWTVIGQVTATGPVTEFLDSTAPDSGRIFWRVAELSTSPPVESALAIVEGPVRLPGQGWLIRWTSVPGRDYTVQRSVDLRNWEEAAAFTAGEAESSFIDPFPDPEPRTMFWRVVEHTDIGDHASPVVSNLEAMVEAGDGGEPVLLLTVDAVAEAGLVGVVFYSGETPAEPALAELPGQIGQVGPTWSHRSILPGAEAVRYFQARASDTAGREGRSPVAGFLLAAPELFEALDADTGEPRRGALPRIDTATGQIAPFAYRPGGASTGGRESGLLLSFPGGATLVEENGRLFFEFARADGRFGANAPLRFASPLSRDGGPPARLPLDSARLDAPALAEAFGFDPAEGIPVIAHDHFPLRWKSGAVTDAGILNAGFSADATGIPLPATVSGGFGDGLLPFDGADGLSLHFDGNRRLGDDGLTLQSSPANPLRLDLFSGGGLAVSGGVTLAFDTGLRLNADAALTGGNEVAFSLQSPSLLIPVLTQAALLLPEAPDNCLAGLPADPDVMQLLDSLLCVESPFTALASLAAGGAALDQLAGNRAAVPLRRNGSAALNLLRLSTELLATPGLALPPEFQLALGSALGQAPPAADLAAAAETLRILARLAENAPPDLQEAAAAARQAARDRLLELAADFPSHDHPKFFATLAGAVEQLPPSEEEAAGWLLAVLETGLAVLAAAHGVEEGTFQPNPVVETLSAQTAAGTLTPLLSAAEAAPGAPLLSETLAQLTLRLRHLAETEWNAARNSDDFPRALEAFRKFGLARRAAASGHIPTGVLPADNASSLLAGLADLAEDTAGIYTGPLSPAAMEIAANRLAEIAETFADAGPVLLEDALAAEFARVENALAGRTGEEYLEETVLSTSDLLRILRAGLALDRTGGLSGFAMAESWTGERLPRLLDRLAVQTSVEADVNALLETVDLLLEATAAENLRPDRDGAKARALLAEASALAPALREAVLARWLAILGDRLASPADLLTDLGLPGALGVGDATANLRYDVTRRQFDGSLGGRLSFPDFGGEATIHSARFLPGGGFELTASGQLTLPGETGTLTIGADSPLRVGLTPGGSPEITGTATVTFGDGLYFRAHVDFLDPAYTLGVEAGGLNFDLLRNTVARIPRFPDGLTDCGEEFAPMGFDATLPEICPEALDQPPFEEDPVSEPSGAEYPERIFAKLFYASDSVSSGSLAAGPRVFDGQFSFQSPAAMRNPPEPGMMFPYLGNLVEIRAVWSPVMTETDMTGAFRFELNDQFGFCGDITDYDLFTLTSALEIDLPALGTRSIGDRPGDHVPAVGGMLTPRVFSILPPAGQLEQVAPGTHLFSTQPDLANHLALQHPFPLGRGAVSLHEDSGLYGDCAIVFDQTGPGPDGFSSVFRSRFSMPGILDPRQRIGQMATPSGGIQLPDDVPYRLIFDAPPFIQPLIPDHGLLPGEEPCSDAAVPTGQVNQAMIRMNHALILTTVYEPKSSHDYALDILGVPEIAPKRPDETTLLATSEDLDDVFRFRGLLADFAFDTYTEIIRHRSTSSETSGENNALRDAEYFWRGYQGGMRFSAQSVRGTRLLQYVPGRKAVNFPLESAVEQAFGTFGGLNTGEAGIAATWFSLRDDIANRNVRLSAPVYNTVKGLGMISGATTGWGSIRRPLSDQKILEEIFNNPGSGFKLPTSAWGPMNAQTGLHTGYALGSQGKGINEVESTLFDMRDSGVSLNGGVLDYGKMLMGDLKESADGLLDDIFKPFTSQNEPQPPAEVWAEDVEQVGWRQLFYYFDSPEEEEVTFIQIPGWLGQASQHGLPGAGVERDLFFNLMGAGILSARVYGPVGSTTHPEGVVLRTHAGSVPITESGQVVPLPGAGPDGLAQFVLGHLDGEAVEAGEWVIGLELADAGFCALGVTFYTMTEPAPDLVASKLENWNELFASAAGAIGGTGVGGAAPASGFQPASEEATNEVMARWLDLQADLGVTPRDGNWGDTLTRYLTDAANRVIELDRLMDTQTKPASDPGFAPASGFNPTLLNVDIGVLPYFGQGPAHIDLMIPEEATFWNDIIIIDDSANVLDDAFGNALPGVSIDFGRLLRINSSGTIQPEWSTSHVMITQRDEVPVETTGFWNSPISRDGLLAHNFLATSPDPAAGIADRAAAVRVRGLGKGLYTVYGISLYPAFLSSGGLVTDERGRMQNAVIQTGRLRGGQFEPVATTSIPAAGSFVSDWRPGQNFGGSFIELDHGDDLVVAAWRSPGGIGELQAFQIAETLPVIRRFTAEKKGYSKKSPAELWQLDWEVDFAGEITIARGPGKVARAGTVTLPLQSSRTIVLRATNASGTVTRSIAIEVESLNEVPRRITEAVGQMNAKYKALAKMLDQMAEETMLTGENNIDTDLVREKLDQVAEIFQRQVLAHPTLTRNTKALFEAARAGLELAANYALTGVDETIQRSTAGGVVGFTPDGSITISEGGQVLETIPVPGGSVILVGNGEVIAPNTPVYNHSAFSELNSKIYQATEQTLENKLDAFRTGGEFDPAKFAAHGTEEILNEILAVSELQTTTGFMGSEEPVSHAFAVTGLTVVREKVLQALGLAADGSGTIRSDLGPNRLEELYKELDTVITEGNLFGPSEPAFSKATNDPIQRQIADALAAGLTFRLGAVPASDWRTGAQLVQRLNTAANTVQLLGGEADGHRAAAVGEIQRLLGAAAARPPRFPPDPVELELLRLAADLPVPDNGAAAAARVRSLLEAAAAVTAAPEWDDEQLGRAADMVNALASLHGILSALENRGADLLSIPPEHYPVALLLQVKETFLASVPGDDAESVARKARFGSDLAKALKKLPRDAAAAVGPLSPQGFAPLSGPPLFPPAEWTALLRETTEAVTASVSASFCVLAQNFDSVLPALPPDFGLPGGLEIERVFGTLSHNAETGFLRGSFGGDLAFPDLDLRFGISEAFLDNTGAFGISGSGSFPLAGGAARLEIPSLTAAGHTGEGTFAASGTGVLTLGEGDDAREFTVGAEFDSTGPRLGLTAELPDQTAIRFTDNLVLFPSSLGGEMAGGFEGSLALEFTGEAGLFARTTPLGESPAASDFRLFARDAAASLFFAPDGFNLELSSGRIELNDLLPADCPGEGGLPEIVLAGEKPLTVQFSSGGNGSGQVDFGGSLSVQNARILIPGFDIDPQSGTTPLGGETPPHLDICEATLVFSANDGAALHIRCAHPATLRLPFADRTVEAEISNLAWPLSGFPSELEADLRTEEIVLGDENGVRVTLGTGTGGSLMRLRAEENEDGSRLLEISGGARVTLPATILSGDGPDGVNDLVLSALEATLRIGNDGQGVPFFAFDPGPLTAQGDFIAAETVELRDLDLRVDGLGTLLGPSPSWQITLNSGRLVLPQAGGMEFAVAGTSFIASNGAFSINVSADAGTVLDGFQLTGQFAATRTAAGVFSFGGEGTLILPDGATQIDASVLLADGTLLASASTDAVLAIGDDFVILPRGAATEVVFEASMTGGSLSIASADIGLFALPEADIPNSGDDFQLFVENFSGQLAGSTDGEFNLSLGAGTTLLLPPFIEAAPCGEPSTGERASVSLTAPLQLNLDADGVLTGSGQAASSGVLLTIPGFAPETSPSLAICQASVEFDPAGRPVLLIPPQGTGPAPATLTLPIDIDGQPLSAEFSNVTWPLTGMPESLSVTIPHDIALLDAEGFFFAVTTPGLELTTEAGVRRVEINGGAWLELPTDALTTGAGAPVALSAPTLFAAVQSDGMVEFNPGALSFSTGGALVLGGPDTGVVLENLEAVAEGLGTLATANPDWRIAILQGGLRFADGAAFAVMDSYIESSGAFAVNAMIDLAFDGWELVGALAASRTVAGPDAGFAVAGAAELWVTEPDFTIGVGVAYDSSTGVLGIAGETDGLELRLTDDIVFFDDGEIEVILSDGGASGSLFLSGNLGLFAIEPLGDGPVTTDDFHLALAPAGLRLAHDPDGFTAEVTEGILWLPAFFNTLEEPFCDPVPGEISGPQVIVEPEEPLTVRFDYSGGPLPTLTGAFVFRNFGFAIPGLDAAGVEVCFARLEFPDTGGLPLLAEMDARLQLPLPGDDPTDPGASRFAAFVISGENWRLDGFPDAASLALAGDLRLLDLDGLTIDLLAAQPGAFDDLPPGLSFATETVNGDLVTTIGLAGGLSAALDPNLLWDAGENAGAALAALGGFRWQIGSFPEFVLQEVALNGNFNLGGENGIAVKGLSTAGTDQARIVFSNLQNLFRRSLDHPFRITIEGALDFANFVEVGLEQTAIVWDNSDDGLTPRLPSNNLIPRFEPGGFYAALGDDAIELAGGFLPVYPTLLGLAFLNPTLPLFPEGGQMGLFDLTNMRITVSGVAAIPSGAAVAAGSPGISGAVDLFQIGFVREGGLIVPDFANMSLDGFTLQIAGLELPPLGGITGGIHIGNLSALPDNPFDIYFAGTVGAKVQEVGASVLLAVKPVEFIGACFELNAGPAGIPIDGGTLGGILLTGGKGGLNFKNSFADPCDFRSYIDVSAAVPPPGSDDRPGNPEEPPETIVGDDFVGISCVDAPFPPPSVNPLGQIHPDSGEVVYKGTILNESQLNSLGITRAAIGGLSPAQVVDMVAATLLGTPDDPAGHPTVFGQRNEVVSAAMATPAPPEAINHFVSLTDSILASVDNAIRTVFRESIRLALDIDVEEDIYDIVLEIAGRGIPVFDITLKLEGTLSHSAISTVLTGSGGVTLSSTGTAVLEGRINLVGIPVGTGTLAFSLTDSQGNIDPAFGGLVNVALGPLELGNLSMALSCDGCFGAVTDEFALLLIESVDTMGAPLVALLYDLLDETIVLPGGGTFDRAVPLEIHFLELTTQQQTAYVGSFFNLFQALTSGENLPVQLSPETAAETIEQLLGVFSSFIVRTLPQVNPFICFSGNVGPSLFGFPLTGGADTLFGASMFYHRVEDDGQDFQELVAATQFSPTFMMLAPILGSYAFAVPSFDEAALGFSLRMPAFTEENVETMLIDPLQFAGDQIGTLVEDAVVSFGYGFKPFGLELGKGQGRVIMPRIASHPENPHREGEWVRPENPDDASLPLVDALPTRMELILAALSQNQLQNPRWRGTSADLAALFVEPANPIGEGQEPLSCDELTATVADRILAADPELDALGGSDFARDFFPHGGLIGGAELSFPNVLAQPPPFDQLAMLFSLPSVDEFGEWFANAQDLFENYFGGTTCVGQLAFYLPAPNPVFPPDIDWDNVTPETFMDSVTDLDFAGLIDRVPQPYPLNEILLRGWLDAPILGMPVARGFMDYDLNAMRFTVNAEVPSGTWLNDWVGGRVDFMIEAPEYMRTGFGVEESPAEIFAARLDQLDDLGPAGMTEAFIQETIDTVRAAMPKASLEAAANLQIPEGLSPFLAGGADAMLFAFSPAFEPDFEPGNHSPYAFARRRGGIGVAGSFEFGYFPPDLDPSQHIRFDANGAFTITPDANVGLFPALAGTFEIGEIAIPGFPGFRDGELTFNSSPDNLAPYLILGGTVDPFGLRLDAPGGAAVDVITFAPLGGEPDITARLAVVRNDGIPVTGAAASLEIDAMSAAIPFLGEVAATVYGSETDGVYSPFNFSSNPGEAWEAALCLSQPGAPDQPPVFRIRDPRNPLSGPVAVEFIPNGPVCGFIEGTGMESFAVEILIPLGFTAVFFPEEETRTEVFVGGSGEARIAFNSAGALHVDFGNQENIGLPGVLTASGRLEFGINPGGDGPNLIAEIPGDGTTVSFPFTDLSQTSVRTVTLHNTGTATAQVIAAAGPAQHFSTNQTGLSIPPGSSRSLDVIFHPAVTGNLTGNLNLQTNVEASPTLDIPLAGTAISNPIYFQSRDNIAFSLTVPGGVSKASVTIGNAGSAPTMNMQANVSGDGFSVTPSGTFSLGPGEERLFVVEFTPEEEGFHEGFFTIQSPLPIGNRFIPLSGMSGESPWITLLDGGTTGSNATLRDIEVFPDGYGLAVGDSGTFLETRDFGRSWTPRDLTLANLNRIHAQHRVSAPVLARYHFEEPGGQPLFWRDDGPNGRHATARSPANAPIASYANGRFGRGLFFLNPRGFDLDITNADFIELTDFGVPNSFAIALWVAPETVADNQLFVGKHDANGNDLLAFGFYNRGYQVRFRGQTFTGGSPQTGWQHLVLNAVYNDASNTTNVTVYRNGSSLWSHGFTGSIGHVGRGLPWVLGQNWVDGKADSQVSDLFHGKMDELYFFTDSLSTADIQALADGKGGTRIFVAGGHGTLLQTETMGRIWRQNPDQNVTGWRSRFNEFRGYHWNSVTTRPNDGTAILAGNMPGIFSSISRPTLLIEDLYDPNPMVDGNEEFDQATLNLSHLGATDSEILRDLATTFHGFSVDGPIYRTYAVSSRGHVFTDPNGLGGTWERHGGFSAGTSLNAIATLPTGFNQNSYVAVGNNGTIVRSNNGGTPTLLQQNAVTGQHLQAIAWNGISPLFAPGPFQGPFLHAVGNNGAYVVSPDAGLNWQTGVGGLLGNNFGLSVHEKLGTVGYTVYTAGSQQRIQMLRWMPIQQQRSPFLTFFPGSLDFSQVTLGESRTLPLRLSNQGRGPVSITSISVTGTGFFLAQGNVADLAPGDSVELQVRYLPNAISDFDTGEIVLETTDLGQTFRIPLAGRCVNAQWQPITFSAGGETLEGEVLDLAQWTIGTTSTLFAVVDSPDRSRLFRSTNGGGTWSDITPNPPSGEIYRFRTVEAYPTSNGNVVLLAGERRNQDGDLVDGVVLRSLTGGNSFFNRTPNDGEILGFAHADGYRDNSVHDIYVSSSTGSTSLADVWQTTNTGFGWSNKPQRPTPGFAGGKVRTFPTHTTSPPQDGLAVAASHGSFLYSRGFNDEWPQMSSGFGTTGRPAIAFPANQPVRDFLFTRSTGFLTTVDRGWIVGNGGLFWRWEREGSVTSPFETNARWFPASDAGVFGTTNIESVAFVNVHNRGYAAGGSKVFTTPNNGRSWELAFDAGENAAVKTVATHPLLNRAWAGGSVGGKAVVWRYIQVSDLNRAILSAGDFERFPQTAPGDTVTRNVNLHNVGNAALNFHNIRIESEEALSRFRIVGDVPGTLAAGSSLQLPVAFDAFPDPVDVATLDPDCFFRFEEPWDATVFSDHGPLKRAGVFPANPAHRPRIATDEAGGRRDRSLRFDGGQYAEIQDAVTDLNTPHAFALWMRADNPAASNLQVLFGKHSNTGADLIHFGIQNGNYVLNIRGSNATLGAVQEGWHHVAISINPATTQFGSFSNVSLYLDGALVNSVFMPNAAGFVTGKPWQLGARWTGSATIANHFSGWLDDFGIIRRALTPAEIRMLANASPAAGEHRARLVINSNSETGERVVELRATVSETSDLIVLDTVPPGGPKIVVNGTAFDPPVAFAVRSTGGDGRNWVEGSVHTIQATGNYQVTDGADNVLRRGFAGWSSGSDPVQSLTAGPGLGRITARYELLEVEANGAGPFSSEPAFAPLSGHAGLPDLLAGTPAGPFIRLTNGSLNIGGLGSQPFTIHGELFVSTSRIHAELSTSALNVPAVSSAAGRVLEIAPSEWMLELIAGQSFTLRATPPAISLLGYEVSPDGTFAIDFDVSASTYAMAFTLNEDFRPAPDFLEFKKGEMSASVSAPTGQAPSFQFRLHGGLRAFKLPNGYPVNSSLGSGGWAVNTNAAVEFDTGNFNIQLSQLLGQSSPMNLVPSSDFHPFNLRGDLTLSRSSGGPVTLQATIPDFRVNGATVASLSGSVSTSSELVLTGQLASGSDLRLIGGGQFSLRNTGGGPAQFTLRARSLPSPSFRLDVPALVLRSTAQGFPSNGIPLPGVSIDSRGAFDTGRLPLQPFTFDGIFLSKPAAGTLSKNHIQLKRDTTGKITFDIRAQIPFLPFCQLHDIAFTIDSAASVQGSFRGRFCVLKDPVSLEYDSSAACQFTGGAAGFNIHFGSGCAGVSNQATGLCLLGSCP